MALLDINFAEKPVTHKIYSATCAADRSEVETAPLCWANYVMTEFLNYFKIIFQEKKKKTTISVHIG